MNKILILLAAFALTAHADLTQTPNAEHAITTQSAQADVPPFPPELAQTLEQATLALQKRDADTALPRLNDAIAQFEKTFADFPAPYYAAQNRVEALYYLMQAANSDAKSNTYVIDGNWANLYYLRAYAHIEKGDLAAAQRDLDTLLKLSPANALAYNERGHLHSLRKDWQAAQADFQAAIDHNLTDNDHERDNINARAQRGLAFILIEEGKLDDAEAIYQELLQKNPNDAMSQNQLAYIQQLRSQQSK